MFPRWPFTENACHPQICAVEVDSITGEAKALPKIINWLSITVLPRSLAERNGCVWRRKWQPTPMFLPGESQGWGNLVGCCLWGRTESDMTKRLHFHFHCTIALISHASKVMLKILQARLQQYVNHEIPDVQVGFKKAEEPEIKLPVSTGSWKKQENSRKTSISLYWLCQSLWLCGSQ